VAHVNERKAMRFHALISLGLAASVLALGGCATTASQPTGPTGFETLADGRVFHPGTGLICPAQLLGGAIEATREYGNMGLDAACGYEQPEGALTVYLSQFNETFEDYFAGSARAVLSGSFKEGLTINEDASQSCLLGGLLLAAADLDESAKASSQVYRFDTVMFSTEGKQSLLSMTEIDGKFLKLRYSYVAPVSEFQTVSDTPDAPDEDLLFCLEGAEALYTVYQATAAGR